MFDDLLTSIVDLFQILIITVGVYYTLRFLRGTRAAQMLIGAALIFFSLFMLTTLLDLDVLYQLLRILSLFLLVAFIVVFHPEIRRALTVIGQKTYLRLLENAIPEIPTSKLVESVKLLAKRHIGTLIAIERTVSLERWSESGILLDAVVSPPLLISILTPPVPLHDGGIIIRNQKIHTANCTFPIDNDISRSAMGTRHRAALSLSNETDALVIVVSEERGWVSVAYNGEIHENLSHRALIRYIKAAFVQKDDQKNFHKHVFGTVPQRRLAKLLTYLSLKPNKPQLAPPLEEDA